jgi:hypothetical protein
MTRSSRVELSSVRMYLADLVAGFSSSQQGEMNFASHDVALFVNLQAAARSRCPFDQLKHETQPVSRYDALQERRKRGSSSAFLSISGKLSDEFCFSTGPAYQLHVKCRFP